MLFSTLVRHLENLEDKKWDRDGSVQKLAGLFREASADEMHELIDLCRGRLRLGGSAQEKTSSSGLLFLEAWDIPKPHTVKKVYSALCRVAQLRGSSRVQLEPTLLASLGTPSARWAKRFLCRRWSLGMDIILDALSITPPRVGIPIWPESQRRRSPEQLETIWNRFGPCYVHAKHDGYRCQIHKRGNEVKLFIGRNLADRTGAFPEVHRAVRRQVLAEYAILDSEIVGYDCINGQVLPRRRMKDAKSHKAMIFDLLSVHGKDWRDRPYSDRHQEKLKIVHDLGEIGTIWCTHDVLVSSLEELQSRWRECQALGHEGLIVIHPASVYKTGRRNSHCVKIKSVDPVDAVVLGYDRLPATPETQDIRSFLLGVYDEGHDTFVTVAKTKSGLKLEERKALVEKCRSWATPSKPERVEARGAPDSWVEPRIVVEVVGDYKFRSNYFTCGKKQTGIGYGLHAARFVPGGIRTDKEAEQATSVAEFLEALRDEPGDGAQLLERSEEGASPRLAANHGPDHARQLRLFTE